MHFLGQDGTSTPEGSLSTSVAQLVSINRTNQPARHYWHIGTRSRPQPTLSNTGQQYPSMTNTRTPSSLAFECDLHVLSGETTLSAVRQFCFRSGFRLPLRSLHVTSRTAAFRTSMRRIHALNCDRAASRQAFIKGGGKHQQLNRGVDIPSSSPPGDKPCLFDDGLETYIMNTEYLCLAIGKTRAVS